MTDILVRQGSRTTAIHAYGLRICEPSLKSLNTGFPGVVQVAAGFAGCSSDRSRKKVVSVNSSQARTSRSDLVKWHQKKTGPRTKSKCWLPPGQTPERPRDM